jgi:undecaprenyl-diphosphatase
MMISRRTLSRIELGSVVSLLVVAGGLFGFISIADEVREGETHGFDSAILLALRSAADPADPIGPHWLEGMMRDITSLGGTAVLTLVTLVAVGYLVIERKRHAALLLAIAVGGGTLLSSILKLGFDRPRPDLVSRLVDVQTLSFPSGHAMLSAVTYLTIGVLLARTSERRRVKSYILAVCITLTLMIGLTRVYLGVHWPTDVLAGWSVGAAWAVLCWQVALYMQKRGQVEASATESVGEPNQSAPNAEIGR